MLSRPFDAALEEGDQVEITAPLPVKRHLAIKGLNDLVNEALERCWVEVRYPVTGNGTRSYTLPAWFSRPDLMFRGVYDTVSSAANEPNSLSGYRGRFVTNGDDVTFVADRTYSSSTTFDLAVLVRASRHIYDGSAWGYPATPGLQDDTDRSTAPEEWVVAYGMAKGLMFLRRMLLRTAMDPDEKQALLAEIVDRTRTWVHAANRVRAEMPKPFHAAMRSLIATYMDEEWD